MAKTKKKAPEVTVDPWHGTLIDWTNEADQFTQHSREMAERCRDYYDSRQISEAEARILRRRKQPVIVINRIKPKMDALMGMERAAKTTAKAFPRTPHEEGAAEAASEAVRFVLQDNIFDNVRSSCWDNLLIEGTCGAEVIVEPASNDEFKVIINHLFWDRLLYDPHSRRKDFQDARYLGQVIWMDRDEALEKFPDSSDVLENMWNGSTTYDDKPLWQDNQRRRVKIVELYYRKDGDVWYACFTRSGYLKEPRKSPYIDEEKRTEWPYEFQSSFVDRDGGRYGATLQLLDIQDEINKRRSKALHLMSVRQVRWERGAVEDINKAREELAKPDGVLETTPGMEFEVLKTNDMLAAQFNLLTEAKMEIDAVGANAAVMGKDKGVQSGVALRERQQAGKTEIGPLFDGLKYWQLRVFRKTWNRVRQYWKAEKWIRVTDDENNLRFVGLNKPVTRGEQLLAEAQKQGAQPEQLQQLQQQIAQDPMMQEVVKTENELADMDVDFILSDVPDVLTAQIEDFQVLGEMVKSGFQMPPEAVIEASPLSNKDKILKMMKAQPQIPPELQKQMEQMKEQVGKLAEENQALKADQQIEGAKVQAKAQADTAQLQQKAIAQQEEMRLEREKVAAETQLAREKAEAEIALKRMIANAEIEIERERMTLEREKAAHAAMIAEKQAAAKAAQPETAR